MKAGDLKLTKPIFLDTNRIKILHPTVAHLEVYIPNTDVL